MVDWIVFWNVVWERWPFEWGSLWLYNRILKAHKNEERKKEPKIARISKRLFDMEAWDVD